MLYNARVLVYGYYERNASSAITYDVYQRLENLNVPISKLLDGFDLGTGWKCCSIARHQEIREQLIVVVRDFMETEKWAWLELLEYELGYLVVKVGKTVPPPPIRAKC